MALNYEALRELVRKSLEECGGMVHPSTPSPITIIPSKKPDQEGKMAKRQVFGVIVDATEIETMLTDDQELDGWIQSKLTKAADYMNSVKDILQPSVFIIIGFYYLIELYMFLLQNNHQIFY